MEDIDLDRLYARVMDRMADVLRDELAAISTRPRRLTDEEWKAIHADDWERVARSVFDLDDPVWMTPKEAAHELNLEPTGGAIYDRIKRRPIGVKFGGRWYVCIARASTPSGSLPGETK